MKTLFISYVAKKKDTGEIVFGNTILSIHDKQLLDNSMIKTLESNIQSTENYEDYEHFNYSKNIKDVAILSFQRIDK